MPQGRRVAVFHGGSEVCKQKGLCRLLRILILLASIPLKFVFGFVEAFCYIYNFNWLHIFVTYFIHSYCTNKVKPP